MTAEAQSHSGYVTASQLQGPWVDLVLQIHPEPNRYAYSRWSNI